jgi:hypothetical protein
MHLIRPLNTLSGVSYSRFRFETSASNARATGLADTLHSELILYGINVHIYFPPTMYTPGYEAENKTKPKITLKIEETDAGLTPDQAATTLFQGMYPGLVAIRGFYRGSDPHSAPVKFLRTVQASCHLVLIA